MCVKVEYSPGTVRVAIYNLLSANIISNILIGLQQQEPSHDNSPGVWHGGWPSLRPPACHL